MFSITITIPGPREHAIKLRDEIESNLASTTIPKGSYWLGSIQPVEDNEGLAEAFTKLPIEP